MIDHELTIVSPAVGQWRLPLALMGALLGVLVTFGGWVWWFSGQAAAMVDVQHRVTTLETRRDDSDKAATDVVNRLARIEGKLEIMLSRVGGR